MLVGIGKIWNICVLYVCLLFEKDFGVDEIFVVIFMKVVMVELYEWICGWFV